MSDRALSAIVAADRLALSEAGEGRELLQRRLTLVLRCLEKDPPRRPTTRELGERLAAL